jgi:hypothetical protein
MWPRYCGTAAKAGRNRENKLRPVVTEGSYLLEHFRDASVVARGQGASGQKASAGWAPILRAPTGFRRIRRADRATGRSPLPGENPFIRGSNAWPARSRMRKLPHGFCPGGPCPRAWHKTEATFRWRPLQSARGRVSSTLSGSLFFIPPPPVEVMICTTICSTFTKRG